MADCGYPYAMWGKPGRCSNPARFQVAHRQYPTKIVSNEGSWTAPDKQVIEVCGVHRRVVERRYRRFGSVVSAALGETP